jgi:hypothetical protein
LQALATLLVAAAGHEGQVTAAIGSPKMGRKRARLPPAAACNDHGGENVTCSLQVNAKDANLRECDEEGGIEGQQGLPFTLSNVDCGDDDDDDLHDYAAGKQANGADVIGGRHDATARKPSRSARRKAVKRRMRREGLLPYRTPGAKAAAAPTSGAHRFLHHHVPLT